MKVKITHRIYEELDRRFGIDHISDACQRFMDKATDKHLARGGTRMIEATQEEVNAVCDEILRSISDLAFGERYDTAVENAGSARHGNAIDKFVAEYYRK